MTTIQAKLKELRELAERATPGIWSVEDYRGNGNPDWRSTGLIWAKTEEQYYQPGTRVCAVNCDKLSSISPPEEIARFEADAAFIAQSRTSLPQLVTALEKALEALGELSSHSYYCVTEGKPTQSPGCVACEALSEIESLLLPPGGTK